MNDFLAVAVNQIRANAKSLGLTLFYGSVFNGERQTVCWDKDHGGDWRGFLECINSTGAKILYLHQELFEQSEIDEALASLNADGPDDFEPQSAAEEEKSLRARIEQYRDKIGLTAAIEVAFIHDGISHIYNEVADWLTVFERLTTDDDTKELENHEPKLDPALLKKWARDLASHPKYGVCKSDDQREFLLEELAGEEIGTLPLWPILRRAEVIYTMEIKEKEEENLAVKARNLRDQGLNMNAIARELHISRDRVSGLLAEGSKTKAAH